MGNLINRVTHFFVGTLFVATAIAGGSSLAFASGGTTSSASPGFFSVDPQTSPAHSDADLNKIFVTGIGPYTSAMAGKIYPYKLPQNGTLGAPLYNGCYDNKNNRLGNLDANNSCATVIAANPGKSIFRLFLGYKIDCADVIDAATCGNTMISMNCQYTQVQLGDSPFDLPVALRECSKGNPIIRKAKANTDATPAFIGCYPGQDGTTYPTCTPCPDGKFNDVMGTNKSGCTSCTIALITGGATSMTGAASQPTTFATTPTGGATSSGQCKVALSDKWSCDAGYTKSPDNQSCVPIPVCTLHLSLVPTNPTSGTNGKIVATYSGANGTVSAFRITSPSTIEPNPLSGTTGTFGGLSATSYTITATDSVCTTSADVVLAPAPTCALALSIAGTVNPTTSTATDGSINGTTSGAVGTLSYSLSPASGTIAPSGNSVSVTKLAAGSYTLTATDAGVSGCYRTQSVTLAPPSCPLAVSISGILNPTSSSPSSGSFSGTASGSVGTVTFTLNPVQGSLTSPSNGQVSVSGLAAGNYTLTATDAGSAGCSKDQVITLSSAGTCGLGQFLNQAAGGVCSDCLSGYYMSTVNHTNNQCNACANTTAGESFTGGAVGAQGRFAGDPLPSGGKVPANKTCGTLSCSGTYILAADGKSCIQKQCPAMMISSAGYFRDSYSKMGNSGFALEITDSVPLGGSRGGHGLPGMPNSSSGSDNSAWYPYGSVSCLMGYTWGGYVSSYSNGEPYVTPKSGNYTCNGFGVPCTATCELTYGTNNVKIPGTVSATSGVYNSSTWDQGTITLVNPNGSYSLFGMPTSGRFLAWAKVNDGDTSGCGLNNGATCDLPSGMGQGKILRIKYIPHNASINAPTIYQASCLFQAGEYPGYTGTVTPTELCTCVKP